MPRVYLIGPVPPSPRQSRMGLNLWAGEAAAISGRAAADEWGLDGCRSDALELSSTAHLIHPDPRVLVHRVRRLGEHEISRLRGLFVTSPCRTLFDIAGFLTLDELQLPFEDAFRRRLVLPNQLETQLHGPLNGHRGVTKIRCLARDDAEATASALEVLLEQAMRSGQLPRAVRQHEVFDEDGFVARIDFSYPHVKLAIEADSFRFHWGRDRWERHLQRDNRLQRLGWRTMHVTKWQLDHDPGAVIRDIREALGL
jgi:very-short-patch-repair endonuclease